jgi:uncharacterized coiled-coil protein SlyX
MKRNKHFFGKRLSFAVFFVLFGALSLYAQDKPKTADELKNELAETHAELTKSKTEISDLNHMISELQEDNKNFGKIQASLDRLTERVSNPSILQIIPAISVALIALLLLGLFVLLLLKQLRLPVVLEHKPNPVDENLMKEHQASEESKAGSPGISSFELNAFKKELEDVQHQLTKLNEKVNVQSENSSRFQSDLASVKTGMDDFKQTIKGTNDTVSLLKTDMDKNREKLARKEQVENDPVAAFNQWAQNPHLELPQYFTYVTIVKLELRTKQEFTDTTTETEWVRNIIGEKKYLFPNPNTIDNLSGPIDKLYKVAGTRKAKGTNSVKITSACQIKEGNFIEYQGELTLI